MRRTCPICEHDSKQVLFHQSFSSFSDNTLLQSYDVVSCQNCGFCFADEIPEQATFDLYYRNLSKYESFSEELKESPFDVNRFGVTVAYLQRFLKNPEEHIVDVGCATGLLLSLIQKKGYFNLTGIDPSPSCAVTAKKYYGIKVLTNTLSNLPLDENSVDVIILVGVLEHVKDLDISLAKLRKVLSPGGKLFISVPDGSEYYRGEDAPFQEFSVEHINFFGPQSLINLIQKNGFRILDYKQIPLEVNHKTITPALMAIFEKIELSDLPALVPDTISTPNLIKYIATCGKKEMQVKETINAIVDKGQSIFIWGTGAQTLRLLSNSRLSEAKIISFIDSNPKYQNKKLNSIPIRSPESLLGYSEPILISTRPYQNEIENQIRNDLGLKNEIIKMY